MPDVFTVMDMEDAKVAAREKFAAIRRNFEKNYLAPELDMAGKLFAEKVQRLPPEVAAQLPQDVLERVLKGFGGTHGKH